PRAGRGWSAGGATRKSSPRRPDRPPSPWWAAARSARTNSRGTHTGCATSPNSTHWPGGSRAASTSSPRSTGGCAYRGPHPASASVCFLAARSPARVVASTWPGRDPADSDLYWAEKAAGFLPDVEHVIWDADESPLVYDDLLAIDDLIDEPTIGVMDRSRVLH